VLCHFSNGLRYIKSDVRDWVFSQLEQTRTNDRIIEAGSHFRMDFVDLVNGHNSHHKLFMLAEFVNLLCVDSFKPFFAEVLFA
jgi:hypothetical protein